MGEVFPTIVYLLCFATSAACAVLLGRNYVRTRAPLLLWSALCFLFLALNNFILILDMLVIPGVDLRLFRLVPSLIAVSLILFGFVWAAGEKEE